MDRIRFTEIGNIVLYLQENNKGEVTYVTSDEAYVKPPYRVRYLKNE